MANNRRTNAVPLDEVDYSLIDSLDRNARAPMAELARKVGLSAQSTAERVRRLEDLGVIIGFTVRLNRAALGLPIAAYIRIRPAMGQLQNVADLVASIPQIVQCDRITGEDCFIAKAFVPTVEDLEGVIDKLLPVAQTNTSIVQSSPVSARQPLIPR